MRVHLLIVAVLLVPLMACSQEQNGPETTVDATEPAPAGAVETTPPEETDSLGTVEAGETVEDEESPIGADVEDEAPVRVSQAETSEPASAWQKGVHYTQLTPTQPTSSSPDEIEVAEIFWYGCPHCYSFEPFLNPWVENKPGYVSFVRIPAMWNPTVRTHARAYYTAEVLGVLDDVHNDLFREIHVNRNMLNTEDALVAFFANHGVDEDQFRQTFQSFAVETRLQRADLLGRRYRVSNVPTMVINGKYVTSNSMVQGSYEDVLALVDELVVKEESER